MSDSCNKFLSGIQSTISMQSKIPVFQKLSVPPSSSIDVEWPSNTNNIYLHAFVQQCPVLIGHKPASDKWRWSPEYPSSFSVWVLEYIKHWVSRLTYCDYFVSIEVWWTLITLASFTSLFVVIHLDAVFWHWWLSGWKTCVTLALLSLSQQNILFGW
jgi:hypothetical protein